MNAKTKKSAPVATTPAPAKRKYTRRTMAVSKPVENEDLNSMTDQEADAILDCLSTEEPKTVKVEEPKPCTVRKPKPAKVEPEPDNDYDRVKKHLQSETETETEPKTVEIKKPKLIKADIEKYVKTHAATGTKSLHCGDEAAAMVEGLTVEQTFEVLERLSGTDFSPRYAHLNVGMQRMNATNRIRKILRNQAKQTSKALDEAGIVE